MIPETTDLAAKEKIGARCLSAWFKGEVVRLREERRLFREELQKPTTDAALRSELVQALRENETEQSELERGWENSSLRRHVKTKNNSRVEQRVLLSPGVSTYGLMAEPGAQEQKPGTLKMNGLATVFDKLSEDLGGFREKIKYGAFADILKEADARLLWNHDWSQPLARQNSGTLRFYESREGLLAWADLIPDDGLSIALAKRVNRKDITGMSFAFIPGKVRWELAKRPGEIDVRIIETIEKLYEVSVVTRPAYPQTVVEIIKRRSETEKERQEREDEEWENYEHNEFMKRFEPISEKEQLEVDRRYRKAGRIVAHYKNMYGDIGG